MHAWPQTLECHFDLSKDMYTKGGTLVKTKIYVATLSEFMETREAGEISQPGPSSRCQVGLQSEDVISLEPNKRFEMMWKSYKSKQKNTANLSDDEKGKYTTMENNAKEVIQELGEQRFPTDSRWCARIFDPISCDYKEYSASRYQGKIRSEIFDLWKEFSKLDYAVDGLGICSFKQSIEEICKIIRKFSTFRRSKDSGYYFICSKHPIGIPVVSPEVPGGGVIQAIPRKRSNTAEWKHVQACLGWIYGQLTKERAYLIGIESLSDSSEKEWIDLLALVRNTRSLLRKRGVTRQSQPEAPQLKKANQYLLRKKLEISSVLEVLDSILHRRYFKCRVVQGRLHDYGEFIAWAPHLFQWYLARQVQEMLGDGYEVEREPKITLHSNTDYHVQPDIVIKQGAFYRGHY